MPFQKGFSLLAIQMLLWMGVVVGEFSVVRDTNAGKVIGTASLMIEKYLGIPYASSPVGQRRWRQPMPHPGWKDSGKTWNATKFRSYCPQTGFNPPGLYIGNEDCLFLNIFVPRSPRSDYYPVVVFVHGGGFYFGQPNIYDGTLLASTGDVIMVTFSYRLGALGFMNTGDNQAMGNYGLFDQMMVLQWVQENIQNFGGDHNRVTLLGYSAGAVSVLLQALSPLNHGSPQLFHRVIAQSGSPFSWWSYQSNPRYYALKLMKDANCPTFSTALGVECLRNMSSEDIVSLQGWLPQWTEEGVDPPWLPTTDGLFLADVPDIVTSSTNLRNALNHRYEFLMGSNDYDAAIDFLRVELIEDESGFREFMRDLLKWYFTDADKITDAVAFNYIDPTDPPATIIEWQRLAVNASRDLQFTAASLNMSRIAASADGFNSTTFVYFFVQQPSDALIEAGVAFPHDNLTFGARHGEEVSYVLGLPLTLPNATAEDRELSLQMVTYWTNFAKTGDPSVGEPVATDWPEYDWERQKYIQFGTKVSEQNITRVRDHLESDKVVFWTRELEMYGNGKGLDDSVAIPQSNDTASTTTMKPVVTTKTGQVQGLRIAQEHSVLDRFLRIPYAKPPVGLLRFKHTEPHSGWEGMLDASGNSSAAEWLNGCPQKVGNLTLGKEDCLYLNVYVPGGINATRDRLLPVMVWLHGGAFVTGRGAGIQFAYGLERLVLHGQVVGVSLNYRLGALGFLSTMDEHAPGNAGFLDQVAALQWVQDNIAAFGGDSSRVTIFGQSAGGGSVSLHMVSPLSRQLFLRGIQQSGSIPAQWTTSLSAVKYAKEFAENLDCPTDSSKLLVKCLQNIRVEEIMGVGFLNPSGSLNDNAWAAVVDGYFLTDDPVKLLGTSAEKDLLLGHNSMDGHLFAAFDFSAINRQSVPMSREEVALAATFFAPDVPPHVAESVTFKYIDWTEPESGLVWPKVAIVEMYTDTMFAVPTYWSANERLAANGSGKTYMYRFSEKSPRPLRPQWMEADHADDVEYVFGHKMERQNSTESERILSLAMMTYWTNFAWTGNPNRPNKGNIYAEWPTYELDTKYAFEFNTSTITDPEGYPSIISNYRGEIVEYWTNLLKGLWTGFDLCPVDGRMKPAKTHEKQPQWAHTRAATCADEPLVRATEGGCVRGYEYESNGRKTERYLGIPYAKPPLGSLRFASPQPAELWTGVYSATNFSKHCPQETTFDDTMSEDCLYLNVYVPRVNTTEDRVAKMPVMAWIHGGRFQNGNGMEDLQGDTLAFFGEVIVVTFNYRLGSFGFLTTDDAISPGNYGLLDQRSGLVWIRNNIANFGGNPDNITIFGNSAGGHSVRLQALSPVNRDLGITKAIMESASILPRDDWKQLSKAIRLAEEVSCPVDIDNQAIIDCLRDLSASELLVAQAATELSFEPTVDGDFLPVHPREMAEEDEVKKWSYIIGVNNGDGSIRWKDVREAKSEDQFHSVIKKYMDLSYGWRADLIDQQYADYDDLMFFSNKTKMQIHLTNLFADERYIAPSLEDAEIYTDLGADVYFYYFTYHHNDTGNGDFPVWAGAPHVSETLFTFGDVIDDAMQPEEAKDLSKRMIQYWTNFAKTGDPNNGLQEDVTPKTEWPTYKRGRSTVVAKNYLQLDLDDLTTVKQDLKPTEKAFWNEHLPAEAKYCVVDLPTGDPINRPPVIDQDSPVVKTAFGPIRGKRIKSNLFDVNVFLGIPFAKPPTGDLRFSKAQDIDAWTSTLDVTEAKPPCVQSTGNGNVIGDEDCLYLDLFMPVGLLNSNSTSMPVVFWIHGDHIDQDTLNLGGSFWTGGGSPGWDPSVSTTDPSYFASLGNVVVIRPNFRLGHFGFLTTQHETMSGNYGLSDLHQALIWAYQNAPHFAADREKLTILGHGSGAAAAELLSVLPSTKNHVKRVISMSGSTFSPWAFCVKSECEKVARSIAEVNGCEADHESQILKCLQDLPTDSIVNSLPLKSVTSVPHDVSNAWGTWRFTVDGDIVPADTSIEELFENSHVDYISGTMSHEFYNYLQVAYPIPRTDSFLQHAIEDTSEFLPHATADHWSTEMHTSLEHQYTNWDGDDDEHAFESAVQYYTDLMFAAHSSKGINSKLTSGSGSQYQIVIEETLTRPSEGSLPFWVGGRHGDDVMYTFGMPFTDPTKFSERDRVFSMAVMSYWVNFAWHGDPNNAFSPQMWTKYTKEKRAYLEMSSNLYPLATPTDFNIEKIDLWYNVVPAIERGFVEQTTALPAATTPLRTTDSSCIDVIYPIGEGLGLSLTPKEADSAIYAMFSVSVILAATLLVLGIIWSCRSRASGLKSEEIEERILDYVDTVSERGGFEHRTLSAL